MARPFQSRGNSVQVDVDTRRLNRILRSLPGNRRAAIDRIAKEIEGKAKASMGAEKHGETYYVQGKEHIASAPGEAPAIDTGNLVNSIRSEMLNDQTGIVFTNVEYAPYLEFGTSDMAPRPFLQPAVDAVTTAVERNPSRYFGDVVTG